MSNQLIFFFFLSGIVFPDNWTFQPTDSAGIEKEVHLVQLDPANNRDEYNKIADEVAKTSVIGITKIERVQNPTLFRGYMVKKQRMDEKKRANEKWLFHGTTAGGCASINSLGFNRSFCGRNGMCTNQKKNNGGVGFLSQTIFPIQTCFQKYNYYSFEIIYPFLF